MDARSVCSVLVLMLVAVCVAQKDAPPAVQGRWDDRVCHLIPNSRQLYQSRTYVYSAVSELGAGTYDLSTSVFSQPECDVRQELYRTVVTGSFQLGSRSHNLERFWKIDYTVASKRMEVFSSQYGAEISALAGCNFTETFIPNVVQDVTNVACPELNLIPQSECPTLYDVARQDESTLWVGAQFVGQPPVFKSQCRSIDRSLEYDGYSFVQFGAEEPVAPVMNEEEETFMLTDFVDPAFDVDAAISNDVQTTISSAATVTVSMVFVASVLLAPFF